MCELIVRLATSPVCDSALTVRVAVGTASHTSVSHSTVSASTGRSEVTASVVYKSYPESRKALQKLEGKIFKGDSRIRTFISVCGPIAWWRMDVMLEMVHTYINAMMVC